MLGTKRRILAIIVLILGFLVLSTRTQAQHIERRGNTFVQVVDTAKSVKTSFTFVSKDKVKYPIFLSPKGKAYIICKSKKTNKEYRRYLPAITEELNKK